MRTIYIIGAPGSGKSTAVKRALELVYWGQPTQRLEPIPHVDYGAGCIQLGKVRDTGFSGTDALGMGINPRAIEFIKSRPAAVIIGEGDRLANAAFLTAADQAGVLTLVWLDVAPEVARERAQQRALLLGTKEQTESWWKGRYTKTARLAGGWPHIRIDATQPAEHVAQDLADLLPSTRY
jgi:shikimate kinase